MKGGQDVVCFGSLSGKKATVDMHIGILYDLERLLIVRIDFGYDVKWTNRVSSLLSGTS